MGSARIVAEEGSDYCRACGGVDRAPARRLRQYLLTQAQDAPGWPTLNDPEGLKSLRDEVVIATGMLERRLNLAQIGCRVHAACSPRSRSS